VIHAEAVMEQGRRCNWRPRWNELRDGLGGRDRPNLEMYFEPMIERVWRCNWRAKFSELRDVLGGGDRA